MAVSSAHEQYSLEMQLILLVTNVKYFEMYRDFQWIFPRRYFKKNDDFDKMSFAADVREIANFAEWKMYSDRVSYQQLPAKDIFQHVVELSVKSENALRLLCPEDEKRFMKMVISNDPDLTLETFDGYQYYSIFSIGTRCPFQFTEDDKRFVLRGCRMSDVTLYLLGQRKYDIDATPQLSNALKTSPAIKCCGNNSLGDELRAVLVFRVPNASYCRKPLAKNAKPCFLLILSKTTRKAIAKCKPVMRVKPTPRTTNPLIVRHGQPEPFNRRVSRRARTANSYFSVPS